MNKSDFVKLCSRAWSIRALALIYEGVPARVSPVAHAAGSGRTAMTASFSHLVEMGLLRKMSGHGHPLRPEFELTEQGRAIAGWAQELSGLLGDEQNWHLARLTWTLPVIMVISHHNRFNDIATALDPITDRALAQTLDKLVKAGWLFRRVNAGARPPEVRYQNCAGVGKIATHCNLLIDLKVTGSE